MRTKGSGQSALLLLDVIDVLHKFRVPYAIIGAFAASFYGVVRTSMDADAMISLQHSQANVKQLIGEFRKAVLKTTCRKGDSQDPIGAVINVEDKFQNRVDLLMNIQGMTEAVFSRSVEAQFMNARIHLIGIEDFIAMKIFAGSPKDLSDVAGVLAVSYDRINLPLLKDLAQKYGKAAKHKLESLLRSYKTPR